MSSSFTYMYTKLSLWVFLCVLFKRACIKLKNRLDMHIACLLVEFDYSREGWFYFDKIKMNRTAFCNLFYWF